MGDTVYVGCPIVDNPTGKILAYESQTLNIRFIPGVPAKFSKSFEVSVRFTIVHAWLQSKLYITHFNWR